MRQHIQKILSRTGFKLVKTHPPHLPQGFADDYDRVKPYTMVDWSGALAAWNAINYVVDAGIAGDIAECGVWRGGISIMMARRLKQLQVEDRRLWLYDTFEGMTEPTEEDRHKHGALASAMLRSEEKEDESSSVWAYASLPAVMRNFERCDLDPTQYRFIKGDVCATIPGEVPEAIAVLRLDTDWFESTLHELEHLYPRLSPGGVLLIDDYDHWDGCRKAVDQYFDSLPRRPYLAMLENRSAVVTKVW